MAIDLCGHDICGVCGQRYGYIDAVGFTLDGRLVGERWLPQGRCAKHGGGMKRITKDKHGQKENAGPIPTKGQGA